MTVRVIARSRIETGHIEEFRTLARELVALVQSKEAGATLVYDFYITDDDAEENCVVHEAYTDAGALIEHLRNLGPFRTRLQKLMATKHLQFFGPVPDALLDQVRAIAPVEIHPVTVATL